MPRKKKRPPRRVAVSGLGPLQPGRPVMRALRDELGDGVRFVGISYDPLEPTNFEADLLERVYVMPYPSQGSEHIFDRFRHVHEEAPLDAVFPTLDSELTVLSKLAPRLKELGIETLVPPKTGLELRSKARLPQLMASIGIPTPVTHIANDWDAVWAAKAQLPFPFWVKGQFYEAKLVHTAAQLEAAVLNVTSGWGFPVVLQANTPGTEYDVMALGDGRGGIVGAVPMKKLQLDSNGKAWGGITVEEPVLIELTKLVVRTLRWRGLLELEIVHHQGMYLLIEINPRAPAWAYLSVLAGQNLAAAALKQALGEEVPRFSGYKVGTMQLRQCVDVACSLDTYEALVTSGGAEHAGRPE